MSLLAEVVGRLDGNGIRCGLIGAEALDLIVGRHDWQTRILDRSEVLELGEGFGSGWPPRVRSV